MINLWFCTWLHRQPFFFRNMTFIIVYLKYYFLLCGMKWIKRIFKRKDKLYKIEMSCHYKPVHKSYAVVCDGTRPPYSSFLFIDECSEITEEMLDYTMPKFKQKQNMNKNCIVIDGKEIDLPQSLIDEIKNKIKKDTLPKEWELVEDHTYYALSGSSIIPFHSHSGSVVTALPTHELATAIQALCQLLVMRDRYNGDWKPNWCDIYQSKWCIFVNMNVIDTHNNIHRQCVLHFKTLELRDEFLKNFRDLIEIAKPLL